MMMMKLMTGIIGFEIPKAIFAQARRRGRFNRRLIRRHPHRFYQSVQWTFAVRAVMGR
jgi:hypothetical protein